jgi:hypothetical protein
MTDPIDQAKKVTEKMTDKAQDAASGALSMVGAYQRKLLEIAQENTQFAFEYGQALASVRSPQDFMDVTSKYTRERMEMFQRHTEQLTSLMKAPA